jgi:hypothetical protein
MQGTRPTQVYELKDFSQGISFASPGGTSGALDISSRSFLVTPRGTLKTTLGYMCLTVLPYMANGTFGNFFEHLQQAFWWERPSGGGVLLAASAVGWDKGFLYRFDMSGPKKSIRYAQYNEEGDVTYEYPSGVTVGMMIPKEIEELGHPAARLDFACRDDFAFIDFVPYGDYCFVFDGVNAPAMIHPNLMVSHAGSPVIGRAVQTQVNGGTLYEGIAAGDYVYAFVPILRSLGEGHAGYGEYDEDDSFLTVSVPQFRKDCQGRLSIPLLSETAVHTQEMRGSGGVSAGASWGGFVMLKNFHEYFDSLPQISEIKIYRTRAGSAGEYFYVGTVEEGEDSFLDNVPDYAMGEALDLAVRTVPRGRLACTFQDRLFVVGDGPDRNLIRYSERYAPIRFPEDYFIHTPQMFTDDEVVRVVEVRGNLYFLLRNSIAVLEGSTPAEFTLRVVTSAVGCVAPRSLTRWRDGIIFLSAGGPVYFDGQSLDNLSGAMESYFSDHGLAGTSLWTACGVASKDYYHLSLHDDLYGNVGPSSGTNNRILSCCLTNKAWSDNTGPNFDSACQTRDGRVLITLNRRLDRHGGVYELFEDFPWNWWIGASVESRNGMCRSAYPDTYSDSNTMVRDSQFVWKGLDLGAPGVWKTVDRVEVHYVGYYDNAWQLQFDSIDMSVDFTQVTPPGAGYLQHILWDTANEYAGTGCVLATRKHRIARFEGEYAADTGAGTSRSATGRTFDLTLRPRSASIPTDDIQWAEVEKIVVYFHTEDER